MYTVPESQLKRMVENPPSSSPCRSGECSKHQGRGGESRKEKSRTGDAGKRGDDDFQGQTMPKALRGESQPQRM